MFCFIVNPDQPWPPTMVEDEPGKSMLRKFKEKISAEHVSEFFTTPEDLAVKVATALGNHITRGFAVEFSPKDKALPSSNVDQDELKQLGYRKTFDVVMRKSVRNLTAEELTQLRDAYLRMMYITNNRGYRHIAGIHGIPDCKGKYGDSGLFLPSSRAYIYWFEQYLKDALDNSLVSVPWWDWISGPSRSEGIPKAFSEAVVDKKHNPLYSFYVVLHDDIDLGSFVGLTGCPKSKKYYTRRYPGSPTSLPTAQEVEKSLI